MNKFAFRQIASLTHAINYSVFILPELLFLGS